MFRLSSVFASIGCISAAFGGVVLDGSFGTSGALPGPNYMISAKVGKQIGGNLFHSFNQFNLVDSESATFTGPNNVQNILARVTSGSPSSIDGKISSQIQGANLFFLNPAGVVFGQHAQLDVSGAFAVTTANYAKLVGGGRFNASLGGQDTLTSAPISSFGFLTSAPAAVSINGANLNAAPQKSFSAIAGDIAMDGAVVTGGLRVNLVSVQSAGEAKLDPTDPHTPVDVTQFTRFGEINLMNSAEIDLSGSTGSAVVLRGGALQMDNSKIAVAAANIGDGVDIQAKSSIALTNQSSIEVTALADLAKTTVARIAASTVSIAGGSSVASLASGPVNAGNLDVIADNFSLTQGGRLDANSFDAGIGGSILVHATNLLIRDLGSGIGASANGTGSGGNIELVGQTITIGAGGIVQASTSGPGAGGEVRVNAATVSIIGGSSLQTGLSADSLGGDGNAGTVRMNISGSLTIAGGAQVSSDTFGAGAGGDIIITAPNVTVDGQGLPAFTAISTETQNAGLGGPGGNVTLNVGDQVQLLGGGQITASTFGPGAGGSILVNASRLFISGSGAAFFPGINASSENQTVGGRGGDVQLNLRTSLGIVDGGKIAVSTSGPGAGGNISIIAPAISISGDGSSISAQTLAGLNAGSGGNITIATDSLRGGPGGEISASTAGSGAGGSVDITAHRLALNNFVISADTTSPDTVAVPVTISGLNVSFDLDHSLDQNLDLALFGPDGTFVDLFNGVGGTGQNFHKTVLADDASVSIAAGTAPFTGRFQPLTPLAAFDGKVFNGLWVLILSDPVLTDIASLKSWSLTTGSTTVTSTDVPKPLPNPDGSSNNISFLTVELPPAAIVPIIPGKGGDVRVHAESVSLLGGARVSAASTNPDGSGRGGDVFVAARDLNIVGGKGIETGISAKSFGAGASGSVRLEVGRLGLRSNAFVGSSNVGSGEAGSVLIQASDGVGLAGRSVISTSSALANAGSINLNSGGVVRLTGQSNITASAGANGGNVSITAPNLVYSINSAVTATAGTSSGGGTGGNITLDPLFIVLNNSLISANASIGQGGNIGLISSFFFNSASLLTATGTTNGTINITAPELDLGSQLITLPASLVSAENQLRERCTALLQGDFSSFISIGRGGTEPEPEELQSEF